ncbi:MAG TPA: cell envelope integrity protein TolA [Gammaproteobacteria bacterium]|nr:cell envelope integrity protein TolA [Gammaproteobacteria bacterium]
MLRERPRSFVYAVLVHLALLGVLVFSLDWAPSVKPGAAGKKAPVQAVVVDAEKLDSEIRRQQQQKDRKRREAEEKLKKIEQQARAAEQKRKQEEQRVAELKRKEAQAKKKAEAERKRKAEAKKKAEVERKRKAEAKKKAEAERKRKEEAKKKAEAERKRKEEAKKKAEAERKRKEAAKRKAAEQEMQARLAAEQEQEAARRRSAMQRVIDEYVLYIQQKVERSWIQPPGAGGELSCTVEVRLIPGGEVIDAQIVRSSGNPVFDRSVEAAVFKASPLPVPSDVDVMQKFRTIRFEFKPG